MTVAGYGRRGSSARQAPLYKRLPKGPHGIAREDVAHHQRIRMHGAMIEAVATHGYERTSVKHVIGLAGVSRRAFYEQFSNKEACFMETFDLIVARSVKRISSAFRASKGPQDTRLRAAFSAFVEEIETNSKALRLVMIDALTAGPDGAMRLRKTASAFEQLLATGFACPPSEHTLPAPIVRAIVGGLSRMTFMRLRYRDTRTISNLAEEMLRWTLLLSSPHTQELEPHPCSRQPFPAVVQLEADPTARPSDRTRLLRSVVNLTLREPVEELSAPHITDEAGVSIDAFLELFTTPQDCFLSALDMLGGELLEAVADPALVSPQWPAAICDAIDRLTAHLVANPAAAVTLATTSYTAGQTAIENMVELGQEVATLLTEGAPRRPRSALTVEAIAGAVSHTIYSEIMAGRAHRLPALAEYLSYTVLAPYVGPENAVKTIAASRPAATPQPSPPAPAPGTDTSIDSVVRAAG